MKNIRARLAFDITLGLLIIFEMLYTLTGNVLHEVVGLLFFITVGVHLAFTRKWTASMAKSLQGGSKPGSDQIARMVVAILLAVCGVVLGVSSVAISNLLGADMVTLANGTYIAWSLAHTVSAYALCILATVHLLLHWVFVAKALRIPYNPERRQAINTAVGAAAGVAAVAIGVAGVQTVGSLVAAPLAMGDGRGEGAFGGQQGGRGGSGPQADGGNGADQGKPSDGQLPDSGSSEADPYGNGDAYGGGQERSRERRRSRGQDNGSDQYASPDSGDGSGGYSAGPDSEAPSNGNGGTSPRGNQGDGSNGSSGGDGSGSNSASGICTLCPKRCPLSAPRCNKPYAAGLI